MSSDVDSFLMNFSQAIKKRWIEAVENKVDELIQSFSDSNDQQIILIINFLLSSWFKEMKACGKKDVHTWINNVFSQLLSTNSSENGYDILNEWLIYKLVEEFEIKLDYSKWSLLNLRIVLRKDPVGKRLTFLWDHSTKFDREKIISSLIELILANPWLAELFMKSFEKYPILDIRYNLRPCYQKALVFSLDQLISNSLSPSSSSSSSSTNNETVCKILNITPDQLFSNDDVHSLIVRLIENALKNDQFDWTYLYSSVIGRHSNELLQTLTQIEWRVRKGDLSGSSNESLLEAANILQAVPATFQAEKVVFNPDTKEWDLTNCFLLTTMERKHALLELFNSKVNDLTLVPDQLKLLYLVENILGISVTSENDVALKEAGYLIDKIQNLLNSPSFNSFLEDRLVMRNLRGIFSWIFRCINLCQEGHDESKYDLIRLNVFQKLASGSSPLTVFKHWTDLQNRLIYGEEEDICPRITVLLSEACKQSDIMIWNGHLALKLIIFEIFNYESENDNFLETVIQVGQLVNNIVPISFRVEVLENLYSLLFLTRDEILESEKEKSEKREASPTQSNCPQSFFIFPNYFVLEYLNVLKDSALKAQTKLFMLKRRTKDDIADLTHNSSNLDLENIHDHQIRVESSMNSYDECKIRLRKLMDYINDTHWRYSVIKPSFRINNISGQISEDFSRTSSEFDLKEPDREKQINTEDEDDISSILEPEPLCSIIPYMLASPAQLLRYCLIKNQIDRAKQVQKLFESSLLESQESCELLVIEKTRELTNKLILSTKVNRRSSASWLNVGESSPKSFKPSAVQSIVSEFVLDLESKVSERVNIDHLLVDYSICTSPNFAISTIILEHCLRSISSMSETCKKNNSNANNLLCMIIKIANVFKDHGSSNNASLSKALGFCHDGNLFTNPVHQINILDRLEAIRAAIQEFKQILGNDSARLTEESSVRSIKADSRALTIRYQKLISNFPYGKFNYLKALFYHVRKVSEALAEAKKRSENIARSVTALDNGNINTSPEPAKLKPLNREGTYFSVLYTSPSAILCSMVIKYGISPKIVDDLARDMKVDLLGTLCSVTCPYIPSSSKKGEDSYDFTLIDSFHPALCELIHCYLTGSVDMDSSVMIQNHFDDERTHNESCENIIIKNSEISDYFRRKSWILASLLKMLDLIDSQEEEEVNSRIFDPHSPLQKWISLVKNTLTTSSREDPYSLVALALYSKIPINNSLVMRALERCAVTQDYVRLHKILRLLNLRNYNSSLEALETALLLKLTKETGDVKYALQMNCARTMRDLVVDMIFTSSSYCKEEEALLAFKSALSRVGKNPDQSKNNLVQESLTLAMQSVQLYSRIAILSGLKSWRDAYENLTEIDILTIIKSRKAYSLIWKWRDFVAEGKRPFPPKALQERNNEDPSDEVESLLQEVTLLAYCSNIREKMQIESVDKNFRKDDMNIHKESFFHFLRTNSYMNDLIEKVLPAVEDLPIRELLIEFLLDSRGTLIEASKVEFYHESLLGIKLIQLLPTSSRPHYEPLVTKPFLIVEQMLMNLEYEPLEECMKTLKTINCDNLIEIYARKAVDVEIIDSESISGSDTTMISSSILTEHGPSQSFRMPIVIPSKEQWVPDYKVSICMLCKLEKFSMFNRRHHCRRCGRVICGTCSQKLLLIAEISDRQPVRVCDDCYSQTRLENVQTRKESCASSTSSALTIQWILSPNDSENEAIRDEFYYQSAPSSSLCLSLLKMHSDKRRCAEFIIDYLTRPLFETFSSSRVDYGLIINLIRSLLLSAKVLIGEEESSLLPEIDFLLSRVDIVKMLVEGYCANRDLISLVTLKENAALRLQEKLIEMERFDLAYHIATKYGINLKQIWKTWAMVCLKHGQFAEARKKFKPCFLSKSSTNNDINSKLLQEIFDVLDAIKGRIGQSSLRDRCKAITTGQTQNILRKTNVFDSDECQLPSDLLEEGLYYLENFGSKDDSIKFFIRFGLYKNALLIFLDERNYKPLLVPFVSRLLMPVIKCGQLKNLLNLSSSIDPTFSKSWKYWIYACKYFSSNNYFHILHSIQVFMGDHIRAAMTQISFFLIPKATDYGQFYARLENLQMAKQHCHYFLAIRDRLTKGCLVFGEEEVQKQIRVIDLQIEITKRFYDKKITLPKALTSFQEKSANSSENSDGEIRASTCYMPTILDDNIVSKTQIAVMVLLEYGATISEGFKVAQHIINDNELDAGHIYRLCGKILANSNKVNLVQLISQLLENIRITHDPKESLAMCDDVVGTILRHCPTLESSDQLIKLISDDMNKIDAYIITGKLKSAYLLAVHLHRVSDVKRILAASIRMKQDYVTKICQMWLEHNE